MLYRNIKTGATIDVSSVLSGDWEAVSRPRSSIVEEKPEKEPEEKPVEKKTRKTKKK